MNAKLFALPILLFLFFAVPVTADIQELELNELYNNTGTNSSIPIFNFRAMLNESSGSVACTLLINDTPYAVNNSVINNTETNITSNTSLSDNLYNWSMNCTTNDSINIKTYTRLFWIDTQVPNVTLVEPTPDSSETVSATNSNYSITVNATYSDNSEIITCLLIRNTAQYPMTVHNGYCEVGNTEWVEGLNTIKVRAFDKGGNYADSSERTFTYNAITQSDRNPMYLLFPIIFVAATVLMGLGIFSSLTNTKESVYLAMIILIMIVFATIIVMMGGIVI